MRDKVFFPSEHLRRYVQYYWTCAHDQDTLEVMYPTGCLELCIDITSGGTIRHRGERSVAVPRVEVLGHWTQPTRASIRQGNTCLITRFHPYAGYLFFPNPVSEFTNESIDLNDIWSRESAVFYRRLMEQPSLAKKVRVLEAFLLERLVSTRRDQEKLGLVAGLCDLICRPGESFEIGRLATASGFSPRYVQKLFLDHVGITPQSFFSVQRFNRSLGLVRSATMSLTSIAYECGYYDQAHFIKEFKSYTGLTPSQLSG